MKIKLNNDFCIWLVSPEKETRSETLKEVAVSLSDSFKALGHNVPIVTSPKNITEYPIILNANLLNKTEHNFLPKNSIIFNFEQIYEKSPWLTPFYLSLLKNHIVFDYSNNNINTLKSFGIQNVELPLYLTPTLSKVISPKVMLAGILYDGLVKNELCKIEW